MSIQTELSRIINAKSAIKTAIEGKGVTVPEATLLDGMAPLIESIEAGGGNGELTIDGRPVAWGILTPAEDITSEITLLSSDDSPWLPIYTSPLNSTTSRVASGFITLLSGGLDRPTYATLAIGSSGPVWWTKSTSSIGGSVFYFNSSGTAYAKKDAAFMELHYGALKLRPSTTYPLVAGKSYFWIAVQTVMQEDIT